MSVPSYPDYEDSDVPWLGLVPKHWRIGRIKDLFEIRKRLAGELGHDVLSITQSGLRVKDVEGNHGQQAMDYSKYQLVHPGDFAMNHMDLLTGWIDISSQSGVTSPDYRVFAPRDPSACNDHYYLSVFQMAYTRRQFYPFGQGSSQLGRWRLPTDAFNAFPIPIPPKFEQDAIRIFLDRETAKIDALVAEQQHLIALLKEMRQSVISQAVTKGLNPNAPMQDSGIEWLGKIPAHWNVRRLRFVAEIDTGDADTANSMKEGAYPLFVRSQTVQRIDRFTHDCEAVLTAGDGAGVGKVFHHYDGKFCAHQRVYIFRNFRDVTGRWFFEYLKALFYRVVLEGTAKSTVDSLRRPMIADFPITIPDSNEIRTIEQFIETKSLKFDDLAAEAESAITLLRERRAALILAAVTGKIDVRAPVHKDNVVSIVSARASKALPPLRSIIGSYAVVHFGKLGRMAVMKAGFLAQAHACIHELNGKYERNAAGPYDGSLIAAMERGAKELCGIATCEPQQEGHRVTYMVPPNVVLPSAELDETVGPERAKVFEDLLGLLNGISRDGVEAIATIYAVWNDLLAAAKPADDDAISTGVLTDWHPEKAVKFKHDDITHWLAWMRRNNMVPNGTAPRTDHQGSLFA